MSVKEIIVDHAFIAQMEEYRLPDKTLGLIGASAKSPIVFSERMMGIRLYAWQVYWIKRIAESIEHRQYDKTKYLIKEFLALTSRQIGKSTVIALLAMWCCVFNKVPGTVSVNTVFGITSASDVQAKKLLTEMKKLLRLGDRYMEQTYRKDDKPMFGEDFFANLLDDNEPNNTTTITFKAYNATVHGEYLLKGSRAGSQIKSYPPTSSVLGETFSVVAIDEAGKTDKISDQFYFDYIYPTGNSTNAIRLYTSTPWVTSGFFYEMVDPDDTGTSLDVDKVLFTIEAIKLENPEYYETVMKKIEELNAAGKTDEVQRAYYCRFVKGQKSFFEPADVFKSFQTYSMADEYKLPCDLGLDFGGQVKSRTAITISTITESGEIRRLHHKTYGVGQDNTILEDVEALTKRFNIARMIPDDCPQGDYIIRQMKEKGWNVQPMNFRTDKVKKFGAFRSDLHRGKIVSYMDDDLKTEMLALEFSEGKRSLIEHAPGYSDDLIDSFVMSCYFYIQTEQRTEFVDFNDYEETQEEKILRAKGGAHSLLRTSWRSETVDDRAALGFFRR